MKTRKLGMGTTAEVAASIKPASAIKRQLIRARKDIQKKLNRIRMNRLEGEKTLVDNLKKIIDPIVQSVKKEEEIRDIKREITTDVTAAVDKETSAAVLPPPPEDVGENAGGRWPGRTSNVEFLPQYEDEVFEDGGGGEEAAATAAEPKASSTMLEEITSDLHNMNEFLNSTREGQSYLENLGELPRKYLQLLTSSTNVCDLISGVRLDPQTESWKLGIRTLNFDGDDLLIGDRIYPGNEGLYRLIFLKEPSNYTTDDLIDYKDVLKYTRAHYTNYGIGKNITTGSTKYKSLIRTLFPPKSRSILKSAPATSGKGVLPTEGLLKSVSSARIQYVPWKTINELIERLRLLYASELSGNTSMQNEIVSIVSTLKRHKVID